MHIQRNYLLSAFECVNRRSHSQPGIDSPSPYGNGCTSSGTSKGHPITASQSTSTTRTSSTRASSARRRPSKTESAGTRPPESVANRAVDIPVTDDTLVTFADLGVPSALTDRLGAEGKINAFPIQKDTLPDTLAGRDVLGRGKTGSGKTLAFAIPMVARLAASQTSGTRRARSPRGLILAPTRELATQITNVLEPLAQACGMRTTTIFGGVNQKRQEKALNAGVDMVVACPGRLEDLLKQGLVSLDHVEVTVLDEADHMADLGFLPSVTRILAMTPADGQRMFFSATLDNDVSKLVNRFLHNEVLHTVDDPNSHVSDMTHCVFEVSEDDKNELVHRLASGSGRRILFTRTKHRAKKFARQLTAQGIPAADLHGNLSQGARDRNLAAFSEGDVRVLVATDVAARGVHVDSVELVVHVDPPTEHKAYLHRSGRTARAGSSGDVVTIMVPEQRKDTMSLLRRAAIKATPQKVTADSTAVSDLVGEIAAFVAPQPKETARPRAKAAQAEGQQAQGRRSSSQRGRGGRPGTSGRRTETGSSGESSRGAETGRSGQNGRSSTTGRSGQNSRSTTTGRSSATGRGGEGTRGGQNGRSSTTGRAQGTRVGRGNRDESRSSRQGSGGGNRQMSEPRGSSPETRNRHRSRTGSRTVYSTSS